jgi:gliding motility-associated-like protein
LKKVYLYIVSLLVALNSFGQVTIGTVNPGPYGKGSSVCVPFRLDATNWCGGPTNKFELWISASGFTTNDSIKIGTYNSSWARFINGLIPANYSTFGSHSYKVKTTSPATEVLSTGTISIVDATGPSAAVNLATGQQGTLTLVADTSYGGCGTPSSLQLNFFKNASNASTVTGSVYNESADIVSQSNLTFTSGSATVINLTTAYYTLNVLSVDANGNKSTRGYLLTNTKTNLNIGVSGSLQGCMPESLPIQISVTGISGIESNHPACIYKINWGDNEIDSFTHCDLMSRRIGNTITIYHPYRNASCGLPNDRYRLEISVKSGILSQTSGANGTSSCAIQPTFPIETFAYIYSKPIAAFTSPAYACVNSSVTFSNTTTSGLNSNCADNADFTWTINGVVVQGPGPTRNLTHVFTSPGQYTVELTSNNYTCDPTTATRTICIEPIPAPAFDIMSGGVLATSICTGQTLTLQDNSNMVGLVCKNPTYLWSVSPNSGFSFVGGTTASSTNPQIQFSVAGTYTITQQITNSCGTRTTSQTITVQGTPSVTFPNTSYIYCTLPNPSLTADFSLSPHRPTYSAAPYAPTSFTWTVTGTGVTSSDYAFVSGTTSSSQFPIIQFTSYKDYTITVTVNGNCSGSNSSTYTISVREKPVLTAPTAQSICSESAFTSVVLSANLNGTTFAWTVAATNSITGFTTPGSGGTINGVTLTNPTNTSGTVTYTITPTLATCNGATQNFVVTVNPKPKIANTTRVICSGDAFTFTASNNPPTTIIPSTTTYTWTVVDNANITGESNQSTPQPNVSQTLTNTTNVAQQVVYTVTPTSTATGACVGNTFTITVTVNPKASISDKTTQVCSGIGFTVTPGGGADLIPSATLYSWSAPIVTGGLTGGAAASNQTTVNGTLTNPTNSAQTATYTVTPTSGNCTGPTFTVTVTVNPLPPLSVTASPTAICTGQSSQLTATGADTYSWSPSTGLSATTGSPVTATLTNNTNSNTTTTYTVTGTFTATGCTKNVNTTITVYPLPSVNAGQDLTLCNQPIGTQLTGTPSGGTWSGTNITSSGLFTPNGTGSFTVTYSYTNPTTGCTNTDQAVITVINPTNADAGVDRSFCANSGNQTLTGTPNGGTWSGSAYVTSAGVFSPTQVGTYTLTYSFGTGTCLTSDQMVVTVNPKPVVPAQTQTICSEGTFTVTPVDNAPTTIIPANTTYTWTVATNTNVTGQSNQTTPQSSISQTLTNLTNQVQTVVYTVTPTSGAQGSCVGNPFTITVTVNPKPSINAQTTSSCSGAGFSFAPANGSGNIVPTNTTYTWTAPTVTGGVTGGASGSGSAITGTLTNPTNQPQTATYTVTPTSGSCGGSSFTLTVTINPKPFVPAQTETICSGGTFTVSPVDNAPTTIIPANTRYTWTVATNASVTGQSNQATPQSSISQTLTNLTNQVQTVVYTVTPTSGAQGSCVGSTFTITVTVNPKPVVPAQTQTICSGGTFTLTPTNAQPTTIIPANTTYTWTVVDNPSVTGESDQASPQSSISQTLTNTTNQSQQVVYTVTPTSGAQGGCLGNTFTLTVTVSPKPTVQDTTTTICSGATFTVTPIGGNGNIVPVGTTYIWTFTNNPNVSGEAVNNTQSASISGTLTNNTNQVQTVVYTVTPSVNGACIGNTFTVTVTVNPKPVVPAQTQTICSEGTFTINPVNNQPTTIIPANTTYTWTVALNNNILGESNQTNPQSVISQQLTNTSTSVQTVLYTIIPTSGAQGNCVGSSFNATITVNPDARAQFNIDTTIGCVPYRLRDHVTLVPHTNANSQPEFMWYADGVLIGTGATVPNYSITQPADTVVLKLFARSLHGCKNDSVSVTIYTIQQPQPSFTLSRDTACGPASILITNTTVPLNVINGSTYSWNFGNGQTSTQAQPGSIVFQPNPTRTDTTYIITLSVTTPCQTLTYRDSVLIRPQPLALFQPDTTVYCSPATMRFRNNSRGVNNAAYGASNKYIWDWGDGRRDTVLDNRTMTKLYTTGFIDTITVKLYAYNECGVDSFAVDVVLYPATITPSLIVFGQNTYGCAPKPVTFVNNSVGGSSYTINFGDGSPLYITNRSNDTINHVFVNPGTYTVSMRSQNTCTDTTVYQQINVYASPTANFTTNQNIYCARDTVRITNTSTPTGLQYLWNMGDGSPTFTGVVNPTHIYSTAGTYTITLIATSTFSAGASCRDTLQRQVTINPVPTAAFSSNLSTYNCAPFTLSAYATPANFNSVEWYVLSSSGSVLFSTTGFTLTHLIPTAGNYQVKMIGYNAQGCRDSLTTPFTVHVAPLVSFSVPDTVYCGSSATVNFTNTSTYSGSGTTAYQWYVNGTLQSTNPTSFSYFFTIPTSATTPLVYTVRLVATASVTGCAPIYERTITLLPAGQVNQPANQLVCNGNSVPQTSFSTLNTGGTTTYAWTNSLAAIGLTATGAGSVPSFTAINTGFSPSIATVTVTPTFAFGGRSCVGSPKDYTITVNPPAQVDQPANLIVCNGQLTSVNFTTSNTSGTTTYSWTNNNPSIGILASNTGNIAVFYAINSGTSPVVATITVTPSYTNGGLTCTGSSKTFTITVLPTAEMDQPANQVACSGSTVSFSFASPVTGGTVSYRWVNNNPTIGLAATGTGSSGSFIATNTSNSPATATITVTPTFTFNGRSCDGPTKTFTITINPNGQVVQPQSQVKCNGDLALGTQFTTLLSGGNVTYSWTNSTPSIGLAPFGTGNIDSFRVVNTGNAPVVATITVTPTFTNGGVSCVGPSKSFTITVNPTATVNPVAAIQVCDGVRTNPIQFTSPTTGGTIIYSWVNSNTAIGLGTSGVGNIPSFTAINSTSVPIIATITVTPTYSNGGISCAGTPRSFTITVLPLPQTRFRVTPDSACAPMVVTFTNLTQYADTYQWLLNNVQFSTLQTPPPMILSQAGTTYTFTLIAGNAQGGCGPTSFSYTVRTLPTPRGQFSVNANTADTLFACKQLTAQINNNSYLNSPGNVSGLTYQWYLNNQLFSTALNPVFQLQNNSNVRDSLVIIKLLVSSGAGCIDSVKKWVRLYPEPFASFIINGGNSDCAKPRFGLVKTIQNTSLVKAPGQYAWSIYNRTAASPANGVIISNASAVTPTFTFPDNLSAADTTYDIRLRVTSPDGCVKDTVISQVVFARPIVNYRITDSVSCTGTLNVSFLDLSTSPTSSITARLWNFDDGGAISTLPAVLHTYSQYGVYYPSLYVTNARGCVSDTMKKRIIVFGAPVADFTVTSPVCVGTPITFTNTSQLGWGSTQFSQLQWDFGDGTVSTAVTPTHTYNQPGTYTVSLTVKSDSSCVTNTKTRTVTISGKPKADFLYSNSCVGAPIQFTNLSTGGFGENGFTVVGWNFGNGSQSLQTNPIITYQNPGTYTVQLIVGGVACPQLRDTIRKIINVTVPRRDSIYPRILASKLNRFTMSAVPGGVSYLWTPPLGLSHPTRSITDAYYLPADPQKILYTITIRDTSGCVNNDQQEVWIFEKPDVYAPTAFTPNGDGANDIFIPFYINIKSLESFRIFNRWGVKIFETNDMSKHWDGTINGSRAPLETYSWVVECYDVNGVKIVRKGMVSLLRY